MHIVLQTISRRVIRKLRHLGYLEASVEDPVPTGYDPLVDNESELARTMVASVPQRIAETSWNACSAIRSEERWR